MLRTLIAITLLTQCLSSASGVDFGCPDPKGFVKCPKIGQVFPREPSSIEYFTDCRGRPKGYDRRVPNVPRPRGFHLKPDRCGTARSDDPNLSDRPCGYYQRGDSCNEGER
ncbi:MAG: hypothetical protein H0W72_01450 [Planctomycetes bacterium]|nr:hypothetical protein [Planctomycetota bacterium]